MHVPANRGVRGRVLAVVGGAWQCGVGAGGVASRMGLELGLPIGRKIGVGGVMLMKERGLFYFLLFRFSP